MPVLGLPILLVGLAALPMLAGIYWLRTRHRRQSVSTLFLWQSAVQAQGGGRKKSRLQTPLTLLFELLIIVLLVMAATAPRVLRAGQSASVIVVLDDSYSMLATDADEASSRDRAIDTLRNELSRLPDYTVRLITAGAEPQLLGKPATNWREVEAALVGWRCYSSVSDVQGALALAGEIGGPRSRQLVLSDHAMPKQMQATDLAEGTDAGEDTPSPADSNEAWGRMRWVSVGEPRDNVAVCHAVRSFDANGVDTLLVELVNHGELPVATTMTLSAGTRDADYLSDVLSPAVGEQLDLLRSMKVEVQPGELKRLWLKPQESADRPLVVSIEDDDLAADNHAVLMPIESRPLRVSIELQDASLREAVTQAVLASGRATLVSRGADLIFTDAVEDSVADSPGVTWVVQFDGDGTKVEGAEAQAYLGPFVIDYDHPLAEGLSLTGLVWSVASEQSSDDALAPSRPRGRPIVTAGDQVLLRDDAKRAGQHVVTWRIWPERSTVMQSAAFPILVWNLIEWRRSERPGVTPVNVRPGVPISIATASTQGSVRVRRIGDVAAGSADSVGTDTVDEMPIVDRRASFSPDRPGVYEVQTQVKRYRVAVNGHSEAESNLRGAEADAFGQWDDQIAIEREYQGLAWVMGLLALLLLAGHAYWLSRGTMRLPGSMTGLGPEVPR